MCGIVGFYGFEDKNLIKKMADIISHRGPDGQGFYENQNVMLANRRLSIIDIPTGNQPIYNEDKSIAVVFNGEIYNFKDLKKELEIKGHRFYTNTDTEVLVHCYEEFGIKGLKKLNGMFAFALYDNNKKELLIARDRFGIKPLYYTILKDNILLFASEIKSLLLYPGVKREMDLNALNSYLRLRYVPGEKTMFKGINKLLPGHYITKSKNNVKIDNYWKLNVSIDNEISESFAISKLKNLIQNAVKLQMVSDVPIGSLLSGGLDTSTIVAFASKTTDMPINTFCMGFDEPTDEFEYARIVADKFKTNHREIIVKMDLMKEFPRMIWHIDFPKRNLYPYFIYKEVSKHVKVVHSGTGGDELLGGYVHRYNYMVNLNGNGIDNMETNQSSPIFSKKEYLDRVNQLKNSKNIAEAYSLITSIDAGIAEKKAKEIYSENFIDKIDKPPYSEFEPYFKNDKLGIIEKTFDAEFNVKLPNDFLIVEDGMSMASSVESRVPFLDNGLTDFCFNLPTKYKLEGNIGKTILRKMMKDILPKKISKRKKWGFVTTAHSVFRNDLRDIAQNMLPSGKLVSQNYIKKEFIDKILKQKITEDQSQNYNLIWNMVAFEIWHKIYIEPEIFKETNLNLSNFLK